MDDMYQVAISLLVVAAVLWVLSYPIVWGIAILSTMAICAVMTIYSIFTFNLMLALNWFLIGLALIIPLVIVGNWAERKRNS